ncbi:MAG TPA: NUDIX hydrolase [Rhizomicrobium sp.]|jgi:nudix-type nucleoside diphosphatase (YffH/AdpP family)|nr:NUDIX hydrolase [Rhizomicrobium sp.]
MSPKILNVRPVYEGWAKVSIATVADANGLSFERLMEDHGRGVCVLPYDPGRKIAMLVRQFRAPVCVTTAQTELLEAVAGLNDGEPPDAAILREAFEETGLRLRSLDHVATVWTMPGISTERMDLFLARYTEEDRVGRGGGQPLEHEDISVVEMPLSALAAAADDGRIEDMKTLALVQTLRLRQPELFS